MLALLRVVLASDPVTGKSRLSIALGASHLVLILDLRRVAPSNQKRVVATQDSVVVRLTSLETKYKARTLEWIKSARSNLPSSIAIVGEFTNNL